MALYIAVHYKMGKQDKNKCNANISSFIVLIHVDIFY